MEISISAQILLPKRNRVSLRPGLGHIWRVCSPCPPLHPPPSPAGLTAWLPACSSALPATRTRPGRALGQVVTTENDTLSSKAVVMDRWSQTHEWLFRAHGRRKWETPAGQRGADRGPAGFARCPGAWRLSLTGRCRSRCDALQGSCQSFCNRLLNLYFQNLIFLETAREYFFFLQWTHSWVKHRR